MMRLYNVGVVKVLIPVVGVRIVVELGRPEALKKRKL